MTRPRTVSDAEILQAAGRAISRIGPVKLTLADVAREVGLSPATLVQRFGSKRGLLLALAESAAASVDDCFAAVRAAHPQPLEAPVDRERDPGRLQLSSEREQRCALLVLLADQVNGEGFGWPSMDFIVRLTEQNARTVRRVIQIFIRLELVMKVSRGPKRSPTQPPKT